VRGSRDMIESTRVALLVRAVDVAEAIVRAAVPADDTVVVAFEPWLGVSSVGTGRAFGMETTDDVQLWVMRRDDALALVASITGDERSGRLLDVVEPLRIPVVVVDDQGVSVGSFDPRRPDGGWDEGNAGTCAATPLSSTRMLAAAARA
jgi:hypothetical protein